jgi:LmbE family N-acetylglucosaminyl deacetylase
MKFHHPTADIFVPDGTPLPGAIARITHLGIGAHQDDLEFMAFDGILKCYDEADHWFGGVTCTNGSGSSRTGPYADFSDDQMKALRREEQKKAATLGRFGAVVQLDYPSREVKDPSNTTLREDLRQILSSSQPEIVYTHNPADKHTTHIGVLVAALQAMRDLPLDQRPSKVIGCEVWRDLDWLPDQHKILMDVSAHEQLASELGAVFDSQITGGKRYDLAVAGRRLANATFHDSHATDQSTQVIFGMDLTPLVADETRDIVDYVCGFIDALKADVEGNLRTRLANT